MTIDQAIAILHQDLGATTYDNHPGLYLAQKLGIEALKRCSLLRAWAAFQSQDLLPGEAEELK